MPKGHIHSIQTDSLRPTPSSQPLGQSKEKKVCKPKSTMVTSTSQLEVEMVDVPLEDTLTLKP